MNGSGAVACVAVEKVTGAIRVQLQQCEKRDCCCERHGPWLPPPPVLAAPPKGANLCSAVPQCHRVWRAPSCGFAHPSSTRWMQQWHVLIKSVVQ